MKWQPSLYGIHQFDPRFSEAEKDEMQVVTYDDLIAAHEQAAIERYELALLAARRV